MALLEQSRFLFSELERNVFKISDELQHKASTKKQIVHQDHRIQFYLSQIQKDASHLKQLYQDPAKVFENQIKSLSSRYDLNETINNFENAIRDIQILYKKQDEKGGKGNVLGTLNERIEMQLFHLPFYERIEKEQEFMEKHGLLPTFTSEERYGKYLDLAQSFMDFQSLSKIQQFQKKNQFANLNNITESEQNGSTSNDKNSQKYLDFSNYASYLSNFQNAEYFPIYLKDNDYMEYLKNLNNYFIDFIHRTQPLTQLDSILNNVESQFNKDWEQKKFEYWNSIINQQENINNKLENENHHESKKKTRRGGKKRKRQSIDNYYEIASLENRIKYFSLMFQNEIIATKRYIEKKQTFTWEELQAEIERDEEFESKIPEEEKVRQVKEKADESLDKSKLLDDESTMPLWLYKRRGLNIEYKCEICGNTSYKGPLTFKKHFQEWRHQHGMNCLRIPNSKHFFGITSIKDALELWEKMKYDKAMNEFHQEEVEIEDDMGNVYDLKTYEDLKKQGLL